MVSYSNEIKRSVLNVRELNLKKHGAVSEFVVNDMAINTMGLFDVDYSIATSGIAGPGGGSAEKPVGLVWFGLATSKGVTTQSRIFPGDRAAVRSAAIAHALGLLLSAVE